MTSSLKNSSPYKILDKKYLDDLGIHYTKLRHEKIGCSIIHMGCSDPENCFVISLPTPANKADGTPHILEHVVLCGSKKYPIRDPFFEMNRRSLQTYMNALTCPDFTCYPAATLNEKDFYNLLDVYLDAVFFPILTKESFLQEGHRLTFERMEDSSTRLKRQGVVYNEMHGEMGSCDTRLAYLMMESLYPDLPYRYNSGGDPKVIPELTHEALKTYHEKFYHPSQALFFFYGNLPIEKHLEFLEKTLFSKVNGRKVEIHPTRQKRFDQPVKKKAPFPISEAEESEGRCVASFSWLTCPSSDLETALSIELLDLLLLGNDASPLCERLLRSGLCMQVESLVELDLSEIPFQIICRGCLENQADALHALIETTLEECIERGFTDEEIDGALHQLEIDRLEIHHEHGPYGLSLFFRAFTAHQHGGSISSALSPKNLFETLRSKAHSKGFFKQLIETYLLKNTHHVQIVLHPDKSLSRQEEQEEKNSLEQLKKCLSEKEKEEIVKTSLALYDYQETHKEDLSILPKILPEDLSKQEKTYPLQTSETELKTYTHFCPTNGFVYANLVFKLPQLTLDEIRHLRLFSLILPQVGCGSKNYKQHLEELQQKTGGIRCWFDLNCSAENPALMQPTLSLRGKALERHQEPLFKLFNEIVRSADFSDEKRIEELVYQHYEFVDQHIRNDPLRYAVNLSAAGLSPSCSFMHHAYGVSYVSFLKESVKLFKSDKHKLIETLEKLKNSLLTSQPPELVLTCCEKAYEKIQSSNFYGVHEGIPQKPSLPWKEGPAPEKISSQGRLCPSRVGFTAQMFPTVAYTHEDAPALSLAAAMMTHTTLHKKVREQGGAYGCEAVHNHQMGQFYFYSYRDPNLRKTLLAFEESVHRIASGNFSQQEMDQALLNLFQDLDSPIPPGHRAENSYLNNLSGHTDKKRQQFREQALQATCSSIQRAVQAHLLPYIDKAIIVSYGSQEYFDEELPHLNRELPIFE